MRKKLIRLNRLADLYYIIIIIIFTNFNDNQSLMIYFE